MQTILEHLESLHRESEALICVYDAEDRVSYANPAFRQAFFLGEDEHPLWCDLMRRNHALGRGSRIDAPDFEAWLTSTLSRRAKLSHRRFESDLIGGRWLWIVETTLANGWGLFVGTDITSLKPDGRALRKARDLAERAAQTDELTGISNRRHIMAMLEALLAGQTSNRAGTGCVCVLDIDHFKQLNDKYGHQTGDEALVEVARLIRASIRPRDAFGRIGGEEFMLLLPEMSLASGQRAVERLLDELRSCSPSRSFPALRLTCSAGLTKIDRGDDPRSVYGRADRCLYDAKTAGRDRVVCG